MNDLPFDAILPNVQHLMRSKEGNPIPPKPCKSSIDHFEFTANPFAHMLSKTLKVTDHDSSFGMEIAQDELSNRAYVHDIKDKSSASWLFSSHKATQNKIWGAYIVSIDSECVFTKANAIHILKHLHDEHMVQFNIVFAPEK
jgi:hypothetical protein